MLKNPHSRTKNVKSIYNFSIICKPSNNVFGTAFFEKAAFEKPSSNVFGAAFFEKAAFEKPSSNVFGAAFFEKAAFFNFVYK